MSERPPPRPHAAALAAALLLALSYGSYQARRAFIRAFFVDGPTPTDLSLGSAPGEGLPPAARVRVVLLDGLSAELAAGLPALSAVCDEGQELRVDVGFPTVSLPVQSALWTGLTQQQSGLQYRTKQLPEPPARAIPPQVEGSAAIAESHPEIVRSFGFAATRPEPASDPADPEAWRVAFPDAAVALAASPTRLVFVHVLRVDEAGHASGAASPGYRAAAHFADELLARLRAAAPADSRWFVLADHGHRPAGGHGGAEPEIRKVRACVAGPGVVRTAETAELHLVDLARALADSLGARLPPAAAGRPWYAALRSPAPEATLPRAPLPTRLAAAALAGLGLWLGVRTGRSSRTWSIGLLPWPTALGLVGAALYVGAPTLSNPAVYPPLGQDLWLGCLPGGLLAAALAVRARRRGLSPARTALHLLAPALGVLAASLAVCRAPAAWLGPMLGLGEPAPPLMPVATAAASLGFVLVRSLAEGVALALLLDWCVQAWHRRKRA